MSFGHVVLIGLIAAALGAGSWFLAPKGRNQVLYRSSFLLTIVCTYMMWAITYLAQLNPLIVPKSGSIRLEHKSP